MPKEQKLETSQILSPGQGLGDEILLGETNHLADVSCSCAFLVQILRATFTKQSQTSHDDSVEFKEWNGMECQGRSSAGRGQGGCQKPNISKESKKCNQTFHSDKRRSKLKSLPFERYR